MKLTIPLLTLSLGCFYSTSAQKKPTTITKKIVIEGEIPSDFYEKSLGANDNIKSIDLNWTNYDYVSISSAPFNPGMPGESGNVSGIESKGKVKWSVPTNKNLILNSPYFNWTSYYANPGDSIYIKYQNDEPFFSGRGAEAFEMQKKLRILLFVNKATPTENRFSVESVHEYFRWMRYFDEQIDIINSLVDEYKEKIPARQLNLIKVAWICVVEESRVNRFQYLYTVSTSKGYTTPIAGLSLTDLNAIWDSTQNNTSWGKWLRTVPDYYESASYLYIFNQQTVRRRLNFDFSNDSLRSKELRVQAYFKEAKKSFSGLQRERLMTRILGEEVISELGPLHSITESLLKEYYALPGNPEFKNWVKRYYEKNMPLRENKPAFNFSVVDINGKPFTLKHVKGKVALLNFWYTGCDNCKEMTPALKKIERQFKNDTNVVFVSISNDKIKEDWERSIQDAKYTTEKGVNVYTAGQGSEHLMIKLYKIAQFPRMVMIDAEGRFAVSEVPDPRNDQGMAELIDIIKEESNKAANVIHAAATDGPYVLYTNPAKAHWINAGTPVSSEQIHDLQVQTDVQGKTFRVNLKNELRTEPAIYTKADKLLALSDIEGNFNAFRLLLQKNGVIDNNFNWTFGPGHLVIAGDVFDRGSQVTECLWLIYSLEEKAKAAGGYVHFILGNHDIMNMNNIFKYVQNKYKVNAKALGVDYSKLYDSGSELGRWLRTKNIVEKIGDYLFVHAGIAPEIAEMQFTIEEINDLARPYYGRKIDSSNKRLQAIFNSEISPFWYRGYYAMPNPLKSIPSMQELDSILSRFSVSKIITGHTIIAEGISTYYDGKVINTDTKHAVGNSEALLIQGNEFYRTNGKGKKEKLINNSQGQLTTKTE